MIGDIPLKVLPICYIPVCVCSLGLDPSRWPEDDLQSVTLDEPWRLRVAAAQAYSIMKTRDIKSFGRVMEFMDVTYTLLPRLVPPIKHMKIMFGLKTKVFRGFT